MSLIQYTSYRNSYQYNTQCSQCPSLRNASGVLSTWSSYQQARYLLIYLLIVAQYDLSLLGMRFTNLLLFQGHGIEILVLESYGHLILMLFKHNQHTSSYRTRIIIAPIEKHNSQEKTFEPTESSMVYLYLSHSDLILEFCLGQGVLIFSIYISYGFRLLRRARVDLQL